MTRLNKLSKLNLKGGNWKRASCPEFLGCIRAQQQPNFSIFVICYTKSFLDPTSFGCGYQVSHVASSFTCSNYCSDHLERKGEELCNKQDRTKVSCSNSCSEEICILHEKSDIAMRVRILEGSSTGWSDAENFILRSILSRTGWLPYVQFIPKKVWKKIFVFKLQ